MAQRSPLLIMAAPNGARKSKQDHPALPVTVEEIVAEAKACQDAGAAMLHAHIRDDDGWHSLDHGRYRELLAAMAEELPDMPCQITTEQAGAYSPREQSDCLLAVIPEFASVSIIEITGDQSEGASDFGCGVLRDASAAGVHLQYILYGPDELALLRRLHDRDLLPAGPVDVLFVLGRYSADSRSHPDDLDPFLAAAEATGDMIRHWMVCAFGPMEYDAMAKAAGLGGQARVGFENNLQLRDGGIAPSNAALVGQLAADFTTVAGREARQLLREGLPAG